MVLILFALVRELQDLGVEEEALEAWHRMQQGSILQLCSIFNWLLVLFSTGYFCISYDTCHLALDMHGLDQV